MGRFWSWVTVGILWASSPAQADAPFPLVVVVEAEAPGFDAAAVRRQIAARVALPVVTLLDPAARRAGAALLLVVSADRRRASLHLRTLRGQSWWSTAEAPTARAADGWLAEAAVALLRSARSEEAADWSLATEVLDPFVEGRARAPSPMVSSFDLPGEVVDPWLRPIQAGPEAATTLAAPRFGRRR